MTIFTLYLAGFFIHLIYSASSLLSFHRLKEQQDIDMFKARPELMRYIIRKPFLWPYYFVTEKGPLERISELFFKHYGDEGSTYFGSNGLKNFLRDVFYGKNRYAHCHPQKASWLIDENGLEYQELKAFWELAEPPYAEITYAKIKNQFLLGVVTTTKECLLADGKTSRFKLDACEKLSVSQFKERLRGINEKEAVALFSALNI